jgi:hypothetical protein
VQGAEALRLAARRQVERPEGEVDEGKESAEVRIDPFFF